MNTGSLPSPFSMRLIWTRFFIQTSPTLFFAIIPWLLCSCISTSLSSVEADPDFNWDTLKRDQILMTPLVDLRGNVIAPQGYESQVEKFTDKDRADYAEKFKQAFFKLRKDIRVFGAGGAFEKLSEIKNIDQISSKVLNKEPLTAEETDHIRNANQDIRFIFFFTFAGEELNFSYSYSYPQKKPYIEKSYRAVRQMTIKMALWDSVTAKTIWIGQKTLTPKNANTVKIRRKNLSTKAVVEKNDVNDFILEPDQWDFNETSSLDYELEHHKSRFPKFPAREPAFSGSFENFILGIPIHPSEEKLIEYDYFTHHRAELGLATTGYGRRTMGQVYLGLSSIIYNRFRLGLAFFSDAESSVEYEGRSYQLSSTGYGIISELEWQLLPSLRLVSGGSFGFASFKSRDKQVVTNQSRTDVGENESDNTDFAGVARTRVQMLYGEKRGLQYGLGVHALFYNGVERPELKANRPARWGADLTVAYTWRGF